MNITLDICKKFLQKGIFTLTALIVTVFLYQSDIGFYIKTSVVGIPQHEAFDGTVYPIRKVPDWVSISSEKWDSNYSNFSDNELVDIPYYDPNDLKTGTDSLKWGDKEDDKIRIAKITYSVPYMGNYKLDGKEYAGSHLAVDIKVPENTPVFAIANGTVIKDSTQSSGFGHHIVIQHNNFPTLEDSTATDTIYSSYSHLGSLLVSQGDVVTKGRQIALSGSTGTATTPHVHFQIDNDDAPWHPFWAFTSQEAYDAGYGFFEAVNAGLGKELAMKTTINPLKYVQKYMDGDANYTAPAPEVEAESYVTVEEPPANDDVKKSGNDTPAKMDDNNENEVIEPEEDVESVPEAEDVYDPILNITIQTKPVYYTNSANQAEFTVILEDQYGKPYLNGYLGDLIVKTVEGDAKVASALVPHKKFKGKNKLVLKFRNLSPGKDKLRIELGDETYYSNWFEIVDPNNISGFSDVPENHKYFEAITCLSDKGIVSGYPDGTFRPDQAVSRVEVLKFILEGVGVKFSKGTLPFYDVSVDEWYGQYLYTAYKKGIVDGNPDGSFKPGNMVNKAEFYKILFNSMGVDINPRVLKAPFDDVKVADWFAGYVAYAKEIGVIDSNVKILNPSKGMTRGEVAEAMYRVMGIAD